MNVHKQTMKRGGKKVAIHQILVEVTPDMVGVSLLYLICVLHDPQPLRVVFYKGKKRRV